MNCVEPMDKKKQNIISQYKGYEDLIEQYKGIVGNTAQRLRDKYSIVSAEKEQITLSALQKEGRLLKIGVVGRVKAGKSSFLNAMFFNGKSILPKAATPMTAALCQLTYKENLSAKINFFSEKDLRDISLRAEMCENLIKQQLAERIERAVERNARNKIDIPIDEAALAIRVKKDVKYNHPDIYATYEQHEQIKQISDFKFIDSKTIEINSINDLDGKLKDYLGAGGKYMPLTKSIEISFDDQNLKDIEVIDTPGINDPVISREQRTRELLSSCDVVFFVSPSGSFMSKEDFDLMDRIRDKEGIDKIYIVASQIDSQLYGADDVHLQNKGEIFTICDILCHNLKKSLQRSLTNKSKDSNEDYSKVLQAIENDDALVFSSGICSSIEQKLTNNEKLDHEEQHQLDLLTDNFPQYFTTENKLANLNRLANIDKIKLLLQQVRVSKDNIIKQKIDKYIEGKLINLNKYNQDLFDYSSKQEYNIQHTDIDTLKKEQQISKQYRNSKSRELKDSYNDLITNLSESLNQNVIKPIIREFNIVYSDIDDSAEEECYSETKQVKSEGFWNGCKRFFGAGGYHEETSYYTKEVLRTDNVYNEIQNFIYTCANISSDESIDVLDRWKRNLKNTISQVFTAETQDQDKIDQQKISEVIDLIISSIPAPYFSSNIGIPGHLYPQGKVSGYAMDEYLDDAKRFLRGLRSYFDDEISQYSDNLTEKLTDFDLIEKIFDEYDNDLSSLQKQIEDKEVSLKTFAQFKQKLQRIK